MLFLHPSTALLPQTQLQDSAPVLQAQPAHQAQWQQARASADRQGEVQELDCKVLRLVLVDLDSQAEVADHLASLQASLLLDSLLLPVWVVRLAALQVSALPLVGVVSLRVDLTQGHDVELESSGKSKVGRTDLRLVMANG